MKASIFYIATLAASAFAAPTQVARQVGNVVDVNDALHTVDDVVANDVGLGQIADGIVSSPFKRDIATGGDLIQLLTGAIESVKGQTGAISTSLLLSYFAF